MVRPLEVSVEKETIEVTSVVIHADGIDELLEIVSTGQYRYMPKEALTATCFSVTRTDPDGVRPSTERYILGPSELFAE